MHFHSSGETLRDVARVTLRCLPVVWKWIEREQFFPTIHRGSVRDSHSLMFWLNNNTSYTVQPEFPLKPVQFVALKEAGPHCKRHWNALSQDVWPGQMYKLQVKLNSVFRRLTNGHFTTWRDFSKNMEVEKWYLIALWLARFQISVKKWIFLTFLRDLKKKKKFQGSFAQSSGENNSKDK